MKINSVNTSNAVQSVQQNLKSDKLVVSEESRIDTQAKSLLEHDKDVSAQEVINEEMLDNAVEQANKSLKQNNRYIERQVHEVTKTVMYTLKDTKTNEVIAEFPPKKIQDMIAKMWEIAGLFIDEKA